MEKQEQEAARALEECERQEAALAQAKVEGAEAAKAHSAALAQLNTAKVQRVCDSSMTVA